MKYPKAVIFLGLASLLSDIASESIYPIIPFFLTASLGASVVFVGMLEGVVEAVSSFTKLWAGYISDKQRSVKPFVVWGYSISNLLRPLLALTTAPWQVLGLRFGDRIGKGIRSSPRDAWLGQYADGSNRGRIFGFHRGMDHAGATIAPLLASGFLWVFPGEHRWLFAATLIPGVIAIFLSTPHDQKR